VRGIVAGVGDLGCKSMRSFDGAQDDRLLGRFALSRAGPCLIAKWACVVAIGLVVT
jgi:hypothetical protein